MISLFKGACVALGIGAMLFAIAAQAQTPCPASGKWEHKGGYLKGCLDQLNLTADQKTAIDTQRTASKAAMKDLGQSLRDARAKLSAAQAAQKDQSEIASSTSTVQSLESRLTEQHVANMNQIEKILTPDQITQLHNCQSQKEQQGGKHHRHKHGTPEATTPAE